LGATASGEGVNFALLCRHGTEVSLVLYDLDGEQPRVEIPLHPRHNRTGDHWHIVVLGLEATFRYGWRVDGPVGPRHRFNPGVVLTDPTATLLSNGVHWGMPSAGKRLSLYHRAGRYDWQEDAPPLIPLEDSVIYELHVRGFTCHPSSGVVAPGTFAGLVEKIPYLQWLGVTAVELLPIHEFDENDCPFQHPQSQERHRNFWGYNSLAFAAPKASYAASAAESGQVREFRDMVRAFHAAGIEIILDVVFNHTGEGDDRGSTFSFRGLDNELYYLQTPEGHYLNYTGCGNTFNCNHPVVRDLLMTCLRYWVGDMHIDGLRFDLASILGRDTQGNVMVEPPIIESIAEDGVLADTKLIAEPWDAAGVYQVGNFPFGRRWSEWNGKYRDDIRRFWKGESGLTGVLVTRLAGSSDLYEASGRLPRHSINFVTCHDGFTLLDLVSYNRKHNEANGEGNRDGSNDNHSWNCGIEGPTTNAGVLGLRRRQAKNLWATLLLSQGVPMLLAGDEFLRTQRGNNNAWCQDNDLSWVDWSLANENADFLRFAREFIWLRKRHPALRRRRFCLGTPTGQERAEAQRLPVAAPPLRSMTPALPATGPVRPEDAGLPGLDDKRAALEAETRMRLARRDGVADLAWHGQEPFKPDFSGSSRALAFTLDGRQTGREPDQDIYVAMNAWVGAIPFRIPPAPAGKAWRRVVDTALAAPLDIVSEADGAPVAAGTQYLVAPFALIVLVSEA
jgi:glycogen operon protein